MSESEENGARDFDEEYIASSIKNLYNECLYLQESGNEKKAGEAVIRRYNEVTNIMEDEFGRKTAKKLGIHGEYKGDWEERIPIILEEIKLRLLACADFLEFERLDLETPSFDEEGTSINIQTQTVQESSLESSQAVSTSVENINRQIQDLNVSAEQKQELEAIVSEFQGELSKPSPDPSKLRQLIQKAWGYSQKVGSQLIILLLSEGIYDIVPEVFDTLS